MLEAQSSETDQILWSLLRAHQQRAAFTRRMADRISELARGDMAAKLQERSREYEADAEVIERILESRRGTGAENGDETKLIRPRRQLRVAAGKGAPRPFVG